MLEPLLILIHMGVLGIAAIEINRRRIIESENPNPMPDTNGSPSTIGDLIGIDTNAATGQAAAAAAAALADAQLASANQALSTADAALAAALAVIASPIYVEPSPGDLTIYFPDSSAASGGRGFHTLKPLPVTTALPVVVTPSPTPVDPTPAPDPAPAS